MSNTPDGSKHAGNAAGAHAEHAHHPCEHHSHEHHDHAHHHRGKSSEDRLDKPAVLAALQIRPGMTILDGGCGNGHMSKTFADAMGNVGTVHAIDPDDEAIDTLRRATAGGIIRASVGDITATTPLPDASVDLAYVCMVVHGFTPAQMQCFGQELTRILKPGGRLAIVEIDKRETPYGPPMELRFSPEELRARIPLTPLDVVRAGEFGYMQLFVKSA